jgi:O-antigen/teichoic acid export membrane protein
VESVELEEYRRHHLRVRRASWAAVLGLSVACGFAVAMLWSFVAGVIVGVVLINAGLSAHLRWDKARWIRRFPELADPRVTWRRR